MPVWFVTGKLGSGKTLVSIGKIHDYMKQGRRVASNIDLNLEKLFSRRKNLKRNIDFVRVPDKPTIHDLQTLGYAYKMYDEKGKKHQDDNKTGLLVLDELGTWFNTRNWRDKGRQEVIDWCLHMRKYGWDVIFLVQNISLIDGQLRDSACEYLVDCTRLDRRKLLGFKPPKIHIAKVYYGPTITKSNKTERWVYRGNEYYDCYDSMQVFSDSYDKGCYTPLREYYFKSLPPVKQNQFQKILTVKNSLIGFLIATNSILVYSSVTSNSNESKIDKKPIESIQKISLAENVKKDHYTSDPFIKYGHIKALGEINVNDKILTYFESERLGPVYGKDLMYYGISFIKLSSCLYQLQSHEHKRIVNCNRFPNEKRELENQPPVNNQSNIKSST